MLNFIKSIFLRDDQSDHQMFAEFQAKFNKNYESLEFQNRF